MEQSTNISDIFSLFFCIPHFVHDCFLFCVKRVLGASQKQHMKTAPRQRNTALTPLSRIKLQRKPNLYKCRTWLTSFFDLSSSELKLFSNKAKNKFKTIKFPITSVGRKMAKQVDAPSCIIEEKKMYSAENYRKMQSLNYNLFFGPHTIPQRFYPFSAQNTKYHHERVEKVVEVPSGRKILSEHQTELENAIQSNQCYLGTGSG